METKGGYIIDAVSIVGIYAKAIMAIQRAESMGDEEYTNSMRMYRNGLHAGLVATMTPAQVASIVETADGVADGR